MSRNTQNVWTSILQVLLVLLLVAGIAGLCVGLAQAFPRDDVPTDSSDTGGSSSTDDPVEGDLLEGYTIVSENLIKDYTLLPSCNLNNVGSTDPDENYTVLEKGIAVEPGKTYCFLYDGEPIIISKHAYMTKGDLVGTDEWDPERVIGTEVNVPNPFTVPEGASYVFISMFNEYTTEWGDWTGLELVEVERATPSLADLSDYTMLTLGDSLSESGQWQNYVYQDTYLNYENLAVGGTKINVFAENVTEETLEGIDLVFVMGLFNSTGSQPGTIEDEASNAENASVCAGYKYIVEKIRGFSPLMKIVLASPHRPRADDVEAKAEAVEAVAEYYGLVYIDLYHEAWGNTEEEYDLYLRDTVHSTDAGYEREAEVIAPYLVQELTEGHIVYDYSVTDAAGRYNVVLNQYMMIEDPVERFEKFEADEEAKTYVSEYYATLYDRLYSYVKNG